MELTNNTSPIYTYHIKNHPTEGMGILYRYPNYESLASLLDEYWDKELEMMNPEFFGNPKTGEAPSPYKAIQAMMEFSKLFIYDWYGFENLNQLPIKIHHKFHFDIVSPHISNMGNGL